MAEVVVTGGGTGIGRASAEWFASRGDAVTLVGRRPEVLRRAADEVGAAMVVADLTQPDSVAAMASMLPGHVDVLVNNAGGLTDPSGDVDGLERTASEWRNAFDANVLTAVLTTAAVDGRLRDGGRIITLGSIAARTGGGSYGAAKAALEAWNISMASRVGPRGITANVVAPGLTQDTEFFGDGMTPERHDRLVAATATGRAGRPADVAAVIGFLASPAAGHVTGQVVHVNGGAYAGR